MTLDVMRVYNVECDAPGCIEISEDYVPSRHDTNKATEARRIAYEAGWVRANGLDFCPKHAPR